MTRLTDTDDLLLESSGAPVSDFDEITVVDDAGQTVAEGEAGELITRGPYTIRGYYDAEAINAEAFTSDGFYRMGDIVRQHGRYVYTEGRRKDLINRGGEKISCDEVEDLIFGLGQVRQVAVVAMADPVFGEKACACVVLEPGTTLTFDELIAHLRNFLNDPSNVRNAYVSEPVLTKIQGEERYVNCVRFNAKSASGGYRGNRDHLARYFGGKLEYFLELRPEANDDRCRGADYQPFPELEQLGRR